MADCDLDRRKAATLQTVGDPLAVLLEDCPAGNRNDAGDVLQHDPRPDVLARLHRRRVHPLQREDRLEVLDGRSPLPRLGDHVHTGDLGPVLGARPPLDRHLRSPSDLEPTGVGFEHVHLHLQRREIGDFRDLLAGPDGLPNIQRLAAPVALQHQKPVVWSQDPQGAEPSLRLTDQDVRLAALDLIQRQLGRSEPGARRELPFGGFGSLLEKSSVDLRFDDLVAREKIGIFRGGLFRIGQLLSRDVPVEGKPRRRPPVGGSGLFDLVLAALAIGLPVSQVLLHVGRVEEHDRFSGLDRRAVLREPRDLLHLLDVDGDDDGGRLDSLQDPRRRHLSDESAARHLRHGGGRGGER